MSGLWRDLPSKIHHKVSKNWFSATLLLTPLFGSYTFSTVKLIETPITALMSRLPVQSCSKVCAGKRI